MRIRMFYLADASAVQRIYREAFSGPPLYQSFTEESVSGVWEEQSSKTGFCCLVAEEGHSVVGATWFDMPNDESLAAERGRELVLFARAQSVSAPIVWIRETVVLPEFQSQGIGSTLKRAAMANIRQTFNEVILLTRMRDDNTRIVRANEKLGFQRTGIQVPSKSSPGVMHEYWYAHLHR